MIGDTCDHIIATCRDEVGELARLGVRGDRTSIVPCGVDVEHFTPDPGDDMEWKLSRSAPFRLVSAGRLVPRKGVGSVVEAMSELPDVELVIAGGDGPADAASNSERERLDNLARQHGVADRIRFVGRMARAQMADLLRSADVVVCTPWYEPFGIVPLEAMACGVPVVGSAVGGLLDSVVDGRTGILVPPRDLTRYRSRGALAAGFPGAACRLWPRWSRTGARSLHVGSSRRLNSTDLRPGDGGPGCSRPELDHARLTGCAADSWIGCGYSRVDGRFSSTW